LVLFPVVNPMAYSDEEIVGGVLKRFSKSKLTPFAKSARRSIESGLESPESAAANLRAQAQMYGWKPNKAERVARRLEAQKPQAIAAERYDYLSPLIEQSYRDLYGRAPTADEISRNISLASVSRVNPGDTGAFSAFLGNRLMSTPEGQSKIKTEQDIQWEQRYGTMPRDAEGNLIRGVVQFDPARFQGFMQQAGNMFG